MPPPLLQNFTSRHYHYLIPRHNHRASIIITRNRRIRSTNTIISTNPKSVFTRNWAATSAAFSFSVSFFFPFSSSIFPHDSRALVPTFEQTEARLNCRRFSMGAAVDRGETRPGETCLYSRPCGGREERKNRESLSRLPPRWLPRCRCSFPSTILLSSFLFPVSLVSSLYSWAGWCSF